MRARNRVVIIALLPIAIFLWLVGWSLLWIGSQSKSQRTQAITDQYMVDVKGMMLEECEAQLSR